MTIFDKIRSLLGLGSGDSADRTDTNVTVERDAESGSESETTTDDAETSDPVAAGTDAAASTGSLVDESEATAEPAGRAEPAEAAGPESDDETTDVDSVDVGADDAGTETETSETATDDGSSESVDVIKGIGPAYAERLADIGIETVGQLAAADAADVAERITVSEKRVGRWIQRAQDR